MNKRNKELKTTIGKEIESAYKFGIELFFGICIGIIYGIIYYLINR